MQIIVDCFSISLRLYRVAIVCNHKRCVGEALARRKASEESTRDMVEFWCQAPTYRIPGVSVSDYFKHGVGSKGIFLSMSRQFGYVTSVVLLSEPGSDKNTCYLSSFVWAVKQLMVQVGGDFTLQDGVAVAASLTCFCSIELLVTAMLSGALASVWRSRHDRPAGALGLIFEVCASRNGSINNGKGFTRRYQSFVYGELDATRYINLINAAMAECTKARQSKCTSSVYEALIHRLQSSMKSEHNLLSIQQFVQALHMLGFLPMEGLHRFGIINPKNSNKEAVGRYLAHVDSKMEKSRKLAAIVSQNTLYYSTILGMDFDDNMNENNTCECARFFKLKGTLTSKGRGRSFPTQATDLYFPNQPFFRTEEHPDGGYIQKELQPRWSSSSDSFIVELVGQPISTSTAVIFPRNKTERKLRAGKLLTKIEPPQGRKVAGTDIQYFLEADSIDPEVYRNVKQAFVSPPRQGETMPAYHNRICRIVHALLKPVLSTMTAAGRAGGGKKMARPRRTAALKPWEAETKHWNDQRPPSLVAAHQRHQELVTSKMKILMQRKEQASERVSLPNLRTDIPTVVASPTTPLQTGKLPSVITPSRPLVSLPPAPLLDNNPTVRHHSTETSSTQEEEEGGNRGAHGASVDLELEWDNILTEPEDSLETVATTLMDSPVLEFCWDDDDASSSDTTNTTPASQFNTESGEAAGNARRNRRSRWSADDDEGTTDGAHAKKKKQRRFAPESKQNSVDNCLRSAFRSISCQLTNMRNGQTQPHYGKLPAPATTDGRSQVLFQPPALTTGPLLPARQRASSPVRPSMIPPAETLATPRREPRVATPVQPSIIPVQPSIIPPAIVVPPPVAEKRSRRKVLLSPGQPPVLSEHGWLRQMDWSSKNLEDTATGVLAPEGSYVFARYYQDSSTFSRIAAGGYRGYNGCKPLTDAPVPIFKCPNLLDESLNCINSGLAQRGKPCLQLNFTNNDFTYSSHLIDERKRFTCQFKYSKEIEFFHAGECLLRDRLAVCLMGDVVVESGSTKMWTFESKHLAQTYLLLCIILCCGSEQYYLQLHKKARRTNRASMELMEAVSGQQRSNKKNEAAASSDYFLVAFGSKDTTEMPYFYLIGNKAKKLTHQQHLLPRIQHDFCIAFGDLAYQRKTSNDGSGRKKSGRTMADDGNALYVRPSRKPLVATANTGTQN